MPEDAPGLPDRKRFSSLREISKGTNAIFSMVMHRHRAERAGLHHDLRLGDRATGVAHSWAYRSGKLPRVGERIEVHQQPDHTIPYMKFRGKIREGYGKGTVGIARSGTVEVLDSGPEKLHFRLGRRRFVLVKTPRYGERSWLFIGLPAKKREKVAVHLVQTPDIAEEFLKVASRADEERDRTIGHGLGSAASNLVTGYALSPWLYPHGNPRPGLKELREPGAFKKYWGKKGLVPALALTGGAFVGGALKEKIQAKYEDWAQKHRQKTASDARAYPGCAKCMTEPLPHCSSCRKHTSTGWKTGLCAECEEIAARRHARTAFGKAAEQIEGFTKAAEDDAETVRLQMAAISVGTQSRKGHLPRSNPYWTPALLDVKHLFDEKERLRKVVRDRISEDESLEPRVRGILKAVDADIARERRREEAETPLELGEKSVADATQPSCRASDASPDLEKGEKSPESRLKAATGLLLYTGNPSERPSAPKPKSPQGFAAHFGHRFNPSTSRFRHAERGADEWMRSSAEYVDLGMRPALTQTATEVLGMSPGKAIPRSQVLKILAERKKVRSDAVTRRRASVLKGIAEGHDSPEDAKELLDALETASKHPRVRYIELTEKN